MNRRLSQIIATFTCAAMVGCTSLQPVSLASAGATDAQAPAALAVGQTVVVQLKGGGESTLVLTEVSRERLVGVDEATRESRAIAFTEVASVARKEVSVWKTVALVVVGVLAVHLYAQAAGTAKILASTP